MVETVNQLPEFHIEYPPSLLKVKKIAKGFKEKSEVGLLTVPVALMGC